MTQHSLHERPDLRGSYFDRHRSRDSPLGNKNLVGPVYSDFFQRRIGNQVIESELLGREQYGHDFTVVQ